MAQRDVWQTVLLSIALFSVLVFGALLYWWTSEAYKIRKMQRKLGYRVPSLWSYVTWCCVCCTGPLLRTKWEREHLYFRSDEYATLKKKRPTTEQLMNDGGDWTKLPRGDSQKHTKVIKAAVAKIRATIIQEEVEKAISGALDTFVAGGRQSREQERQVERIRAAAARWRGMAKGDLHSQRQREIEAMLQESDSGSSDDDDNDFFGCEVSFMKMTHAKVPKPTLRLAPPAAKPMIMGAWGKKESPRKQPPPAAAGGEWGGAMMWGNDDDKRHVSGRGGPRIRVAGSKPTSVKELKELLRVNRREMLLSEFSMISLNQPLPDNLSPGHRRYTANAALFPFAESRVRVQVDGRHRYINGSYMRGPDGRSETYIVTQVPLTAVDNRVGKAATAGDFWLMIFDHRCPVVVLLDADVPPYWPVEEARPHVYGEMRVSLQSDFHGKDFNEIVLTITRNKRTHRVSLLIFYLWQRNALPQTSPFLALMKFANIIARRDESGPLVFQDYDGGDRAGVAVAIDHILYQVKRSANVDLMRTVANIREDRGGLISTLDLYWYLHEIACTYALAIGAGPAPPAYVKPPTMDGQRS